ncbi:MAG: Cof-type HAD-IIB family hydrolase [Prolixibacteraceae bacterium]
MIKTIFFDIDGTLISFKTHRIPESTQIALRLLKKEGIRMFIATGRSASQISHLGGFPFDGYITYNGSYCFTADDQVIFKSPVPTREIKRLTSYLNDNDHPFPCSFMTGEGTFINYVDHHVQHIAELVNVPLPVVRRLEDTTTEEIFQIGVYLGGQEEEVIMRTVLNNCVSNRWHPSFTDVNKAGNTKDAGIDRVISSYGISLSEVMAFGDGGNDLKMLSHVPFGVAMGNANEQVKSVANYVTESVDENGVWNALVHLNVLEGTKIGG